MRKEAEKAFKVLDEEMKKHDGSAEPTAEALAPELRGLFTQVLKLCQKAGLVRLGDELPAELAHHEGRLKKIQEAMEALEREG